MARNVTKEQLIVHKDNAISALDSYLSSLIENPDPKIHSKSDKFSYWLEDWSTFLEFEHRFSPSHLRRYKRGEIVKAHLGYNIGSEEGGLHYCVVIDKDNSKNSPVITIIPLTSVKPTTDIEHLPKGSIFLGNELFTSLNSKFASESKRLAKELGDLQNLLSLREETSDAEIEDILSKKTNLELENILSKIELCERNQELCRNVAKEIQRMKRGSIALVHQIRTISKIRIYDPKTNFDILSNVKLSNEKLDLIDTEIINSFTK